MEKYRKFVVALVGGAALVAASLGLPQAGAEDEAVGLVNAVLALLTALGVRQVPNEPEYVPPAPQVPPVA